MFVVAVLYSVYCNKQKTAGYAGYFSFEFGILVCRLQSVLGHDSGPAGSPNCPKCAVNVLVVVLMHFCPSCVSRVAALNDEVLRGKKMNQTVPGRRPAVLILLSICGRRNLKYNGQRW
jgi:hypothetical protein